MLSKTLQDGLNDYGIGAKIRALRLKKKIGLVDLGKHTGLSAALLSKIERGRLFPTLPTLLRIALVFGVGLEYFFAGSREKPPGWSCPTVRAHVTWRIGSRRSITRRPNGGSTGITPSSCRWPSRSYS